MERRGRIIRRIWAACLVLAGLNHARILVQNGLFWDYNGIGWMSAAYWSSLTVIDPLAAILLLIRPRAGVILATIVIATNVVHNLVVTAYHAPSGRFIGMVMTSPQLLSQIGFLVFVLATWRIAWPDAPGRR